MMRSAAAALSLLAALACGGSGGSGGTTGGSTGSGSAVAHSILPAATDPAIQTYPQAHLTLTPDPGAAAKHRLFVFLPGTGGQPAYQQLVLQTGSAQGYHAVGLMYPNTPSIGSLCDDSTDPDAHWKARAEIVTGQDLSTLVSVNATECIEHRLTALLAYLDATYPPEQWGQYLVAGQVDWTKVVIAGHSQGGGHAGVLAKLHPVYRCVCFSSPADWRNPVNRPASWYAAPGATDASKIFGFSHQQDELVTWPLVRANWIALGLDAYGAAVNVDATAAPYGGSHALTSNLPHATTTGGYPASYHSATVVDLSTPKLADGSPAYRPVWIQLCFP
jgi:pimeloyl-ACP methyl ester carboxylesterase